MPDRPTGLGPILPDRTSLGVFFNELEEKKKGGWAGLTEETNEAEKVNP